MLGRKIIIRVAFFFQILQNIHFLLHFKLHSTKEDADVRKQALPFVPARYIRTFDVISEVNCVLLPRKRKFDTIALHPNFDVIFEVNCVLPRSRQVSNGGQLKAEIIPVHSGRLVCQSVVLSKSPSKILYFWNDWFSMIVAYSDKYVLIFGY